MVRFGAWLCSLMVSKSPERVILSFSFSGMNQWFRKYQGQDGNLLLYCWGHRVVEERGQRKERGDVF